MSGLPQGLFVSQDVQAREVKLPDGSVHTLHFKQVPAIEFRRFSLAENSGNEKRQESNVAALIASSLCNAEGGEALTLKQALDLNAAAAKALMRAVLDVNGVGDEGND